MKKQKNKQVIKASKLAKAENMKKKVITVQNAEGEPETQAEILIQNKIGYTPKVSVIIPVYNVEEYLRECLDSIVKQTLREIEIICVDDGSTDNSLEILKEYAKKDNRITVITQKNLHAGVARNAGLAVAKGEYLSFLDSDDFFEINMLEETYSKAKSDNAEIIIFGNYVYDQTKQEDIRKTTYLEKFIEKSPFRPEEFSKDLFLISNPNAWTKLFKRETIIANNVFFENYTSCNDITFVNTMLTLVKKISLTNTPYVHYRINTKINISADRGAKASCFIYAVKKLENNLKKHQTYGTYKETLETRIDKSFNWELNQCNGEQKENLRKLSFDILGKDYTQQPKVSVIIPVYNTAEFLPQCLDSIIYQTLKEIEIICVNDGSTDNSLEILKEYAKKDNRIIVINQKNQGLSCTRNNALKIAKGKYIQFLDSDDWLQKDALYLLYNKAHKTHAEMVHFEGISYYIDTQKFEQPKGLKIEYVQDVNKIYSNQEITKFILNIPISACLFFYKNEFIKENELIFPEKLCFEDNYFVHRALNAVKHYVILKEILYNRTKHSQQITANWDKHIYDYIKIIQLIIEFYIKKRKDVPITTAVINQYCNALCWRYKSLQPETQKGCKARILKMFKQIPSTIKLSPQIIKFMQENIQNDNNKKRLLEWYKLATGKYLNLENPRTYNEKMQWLKLYDSTPIKTHLADKYLVRDWIKEKIGERYLVPLLGVYDKFEEIDFSKLPNQFVIKCNHGSGWNIIVKDKSKLDLKEAKEKVDRWVSDDYSTKWGCELHYRGIIPKIIIEEYINPHFSNHEIQCWVFNKEIKFISVETIKDDDNLERGTFYPDGKRTEFEISPNHYKRMKNISSRKAFDKAIELAQKLIIDVPYVRIDFIEYEDDVKFREMTFTSGSGLSVIKPDKYNLILGNMIKLPKLAYNIDTGEYYKLPKKSKIKPCLLLPYNLCQKIYLKRKERTLNKRQVHKQLTNSRIDIKNFGNANNAVEITTLAKISAPAWFTNAQGQGQVVESSKKIQNITIRAVQDGKLILSFKGQDKRYNGTRFQLWVDYKSIKIDGKEILSAPVETWHDKPFRYEMPVKDGQVVKVEVVQQYHQYSKDELKDVILKLNPNSDYIRENINKLTDKIYKKITVKKTTSNSTLQKALFTKAKQNIQARIKLWRDKFSFAHKLTPVIDLMQKNQIQTLKMLQELQKKSISLENKNNELKNEVEVLKSTFNTQLSDLKKLQEESTKQLIATGDKFFAEFSRAMEEFQNYGISEISKIKNYYADFAYQLGNTEVRLLNELSMQRETAQQNKNNIISGVNQTEQSLHTQVAKFQEMVQEQQAVLDSVQKSLEDLSGLKEIDFAQQEELKSLTKELETQKSHLVKEVQNLQNKVQRQYQELNFADLLHDSTKDSPWLKDRSFALYGWAANYSFIYTLFRILDNIRPAYILEMGLGQTSLVTSQYIANNNPEADLDIIENDTDWINVYRSKLAQHKNIRLHQCDIEFFDYAGEKNRKYKDLHKITQEKKYNLILVDGPIGGAQKFPRSNIVDLVQQNLAEDFIIIFDDAERSGEQNTIAKTKEKLSVMGIDFGVQQRNALKSQVLIFSKSCEFAKYL